MPSMMNTVINSKQKELIAAFEEHRKHFKVSKDTRMKLKMCFHIFRQRVLNLRAHLDTNDTYQIVSDEIRKFQDAHRNFLDAVSWDKLYGAIKSCAYECPSSDPVERIKRSFLVELAADAPDVDDEEALEGDISDDAKENEAQSDDAKAPKAYHEMHLHASTKMLIEGYYNQVVSKIKESLQDSFWNQL